MGLLSGRVAAIDGAGATRERASRAPAVITALVLVGVLVVLASSVFSIASRSRSVARGSVVLHSLNEGLRAATVARAQIVFAAYLAESDAAYGTRSRGAIGVALGEARAGLTDLSVAVAALPEGTLDPISSAAVTDFTDLAGETVSLVEAGKASDARVLVRDGLVPAFAEARDRIVDRRDQALEDVTGVGRLLGRLGNLASFVITFLLPSVAVLVYRQLRKRSRHSVELAVELARERGQAERRDRSVLQQLDALRLELDAVAGLPVDRQAPTARRVAVTAGSLASVALGPEQLAFGRVELVSALHGAVRELRLAGIAIDLRGAEGAAWTDAEALRSALLALVVDAHERGATEILVDAVDADGHATIAIAHDGARLPAAERDALFVRATPEQRIAVEACEAPVRLLAALQATEAAGGTLTPVDGTLRSGYALRFPRADAIDVDGAAASPAALASAG